MIKTLRTPMAIALAVLSLGAHSAAVTLPTVTFDDQAADAIKADGPVEANSVPSLGIQGAWVYVANFNTPNDFDPVVPSGTTGGYVFNRSRDLTSLSSIVLTLTTAAGKLSTQATTEQFFTSLTFNLLLKGTLPLVLNAYSGTGGVPVASPTFTPGSGVSDWPSNTVDFDATDRIDRLEFVAAPGVAFGLDNLAVSLSTGSGGGGGGGNVPEPASYALVAVALLAAGGASRQRKA